MARLGCLLVVLSLQLAQSLLQPAIARSYAHSSARPLAVRSRMVFNLAGDEVNGYRELGLPEDATYDAVMDAFMELSEQYRDDPERVLVSARPCTPLAIVGLRPQRRAAPDRRCLGARVLRRSRRRRTRCSTSGSSSACLATSPAPLPRPSTRGRRSAAPSRRLSSPPLLPHLHHLHLHHHPRTLSPRRAGAHPAVGHRQARGEEGGQALRGAHLGPRPPRPTPSPLP